MSVNKMAIYDLARKATQMELIDLIDSEYDNLMYLGSIVEQYIEYNNDKNDNYYYILLTQINNTKETLTIYKQVFNEREKEYSVIEHLKILNNSSIPIVPLE
jgi:hypothetical protein